MNKNDQSKTEGTPHVGSSAVLAAALEMMNKMRPIKEVPKPVAHRLAVAEKMLGRALCAGEISMVICMCAGEEVLNRKIADTNFFCMDMPVGG